MELYEKNGNILYILNVLKKFSDEEHKLKVVDIQRKIKEIYDVEIDTRTIRRNIIIISNKARIGANSKWRLCYVKKYFKLKLLGSRSSSLQIRRKIL